MAMMGWYHDSAWGLGGWLFMTLSMTLVWGGLIAAVVLMFRSERQTTQTSAGTPAGTAAGTAGSAPELVLGERFARGEIDETEYRLRLEVLRGQPTG